MGKLAEYDLEQFDEIYADLKYFEAKTGRRLNESERNSKSSPDENSTPKKTNKALDALIMATETEVNFIEDILFCFRTSFTILHYFLYAVRRIGR